MKNIIIFGGSGFIGMNVVEYFSNKKNFKVTATYLKSKPIKKNKWVDVDKK